MHNNGKHGTRLVQVARDAMPAGILAAAVGVGAFLIGLADPIGYGLLTLVAGLFTSPLLQPAKPQPLPIRIRSRDRR